MDYIYSQLNNTIDRVEADFTQTIVKNDFITPLETAANDTELIINTSNLVRLLPIKNDYDETDDTIQQYQLFGYNHNTALFDIPLGEPISINHKNTATSFSCLKFKCGSTGELIDVKCETDETGATVIDYLPIAALSDVHIADDGSVVQVESIIDGNDE